MPTAVCQICSKEFYAKPFFLKRGHAKYCSDACMRIASRTDTVVKCYACGKEVYKTKKALRVSKSKTYFCTKSCQTKWRNSVFIGPKHANWKDGSASYRSVMLKNKIPQVCRLCRTDDLRVLAVHHIDRNRKNSALSNLAWLCHNCHFLLHHYEEVEKKFMEALV